MLRWMTEDFERLEVASPRLDGELLLAHVLQVQRVQLYLDMERPLSAEELTRVRQLVKRRRTHEPVAYILGQREFYGRPFMVDRRVLVPRPDTELLVDRALARLGSPAGPAKQPTPAEGATEPEAGQMDETAGPAGPGALPMQLDEAPRVLDLCTGSGCVALTLAAERPGLHVDAVDCSADALAVARQNAALLGLQDQVCFWEGDLCAPLPTEARYTLITCNPPYVSPAQWQDLAPDVREHEPKLALVAEDDGLACYEALLRQVPDRLRTGGQLLLEVGQGQADSVAELCVRAGLRHTALHRDLGGIMRVVVASV